MERYGFFSGTAASKHSYCFYTQNEPPVGHNVVVVTFVGRKGDKGDTDKNFYRWSDKERLGSLGQIIGEQKKARRWG